MTMIQETQRVGIIGFGNQARAWAHNLRDSGLDVEIYLRANSNSISRATQEGFSVHSLFMLGNRPPETIALLIPDHEHLSLLESIKLPAGTTIIYAHGYAMHRYQLATRFPEWRHWLLAPKAIADQLRANYQTGEALAAFISSEFDQHPDQANVRLRHLAKMLGINRGPYLATFAQEAMADMLSEQAVLCSSIPYSARETFTFLLKKGLPPELAFYECFYEMKLIVDAMLNAGPSALFHMISPNAFLGSQKAKGILFDDHFPLALEKLWQDLENGVFYQELDKKMPQLKDLREQESATWNPAIKTEFERFSRPDYDNDDKQQKGTMDHQDAPPL